ncbi:hypothetical protein CP532_1804 [Ophiocordyceps camponoti-leonardi (nom. inval.)]|nr:hypothetical protein CP532_1804 [Ophiocordyceps camponoti-leonardi (nom. inval.)]
MKPLSIIPLLAASTSIIPHLWAAPVPASDEENKELGRAIVPWDLFDDPRNHLHDEPEMVITLINATPYRWRKGYTHSYKAPRWEFWPDVIYEGETKSAYISSLRFSKDSAAEVVYHLEGTEKPMSIRVEWRSGKYHDTYIVFQEELETMNNAKETTHFLGAGWWPNGVGFMLAGTEGKFISNDGPLGWMQSLLPHIGDFSLRELAMPRSHHAGMWKFVAPIGFGSFSNTATQLDDIWSQLGNGGVRVFDMRPTLWHHHFRESHHSSVGFLGEQGAYGAGIEEMIDLINRFNKEVPGELIIVDIHPQLVDARRWEDLFPEQLEDLYNLMRKLEHRIAVPDDEDVTAWPLNRFIGDGQSAVLIRFASGWLDKADKEKGKGIFPGGKEGFVTEKNFHTNGHWSNTNKLSVLVEDQFTEMQNSRPHRDSPMLDLSWVMSQEALETVAGPSIIELSKPTWRALYSVFWTFITENMYPNWISMDNSHGSQLKAMVMTINYCLVARQCGGLGGKVDMWWVEQRRLEAEKKQKEEEETKNHKDDDRDDKDDKKTEDDKTEDKDDDKDRKDKEETKENDNYNDKKKDKEDQRDKDDDIDHKDKDENEDKKEDKKEDKDRKDDDKDHKDKEEDKDHKDKDKEETKKETKENDNGKDKEEEEEEDKDNLGLHQS